LVAGLQQEHGLTERRACAAVSLGRSVYRYRRRSSRDDELIKLLLELAHRRTGRRWNHKRVHRVYCSLKLNKRRKGKRRLPTRDPAPLQWAEEHGVTLEFIKPGKPMQNGFNERFNRSYRQAVLDMFVFQTLNEVGEQTEIWLKEYNEEPHDSLGDMTPREYLLTQKPEISTCGWT
jgi:putative transposase